MTTPEQTIREALEFRNGMLNLGPGPDYVMAAVLPDEVRLPAFAALDALVADRDRWHEASLATAKELARALERCGRNSCAYTAPVGCVCTAPLRWFGCPNCGAWYHGLHGCPHLRDLSPLGGGPNR